MDISVSVCLHDFLLHFDSMVDLFLGEISYIIRCVIQTLAIGRFFISKLVVGAAVRLHQLVQGRTLVTRLHPGLVGLR